MCNLTKHLKDERVFGYKVVAKKDYKYYAIAMGFEYKQPSMTFSKDDRLVQKSLSPYFRDFILNTKKRAFKENMVGRTAAFFDVEEAAYLKHGVCYSCSMSYKVVIVMVELSNDIMEGFYGTGIVYAGRTIKILNEV